MALSDRHAGSPGSAAWRRVVIMIVVAGVLGGAIYAYGQRHVYRISIDPGEVAFIDVDVPMQRFGRPKSFAKERGLPVTCAVSGTGSEGVHFAVVRTGHTVHRLRARVRIEASAWARPGTVRRSIEFTIDGQDGWPKAGVIVTVSRGGAT